MNTQTISWIQPELVSYTSDRNTMHAKINFRDGLGATNITIKRGDGFWMWIDGKYQNRRFSTLEGMAWEFELPSKLVFALSMLSVGEVTEQPFMNYALMSKKHEEYMRKSGYKAKTGSNYTKPKKRRK